MTRFLYPAELWHAGPTEVIVSFRDVQGCHTSGENEAEALTEAEDALEEAIAGCISREGPIPAPSEPLPGEHLVALTAEMSAKAALAMALRSSGLTCVDVAERMGTNEKVVRELLSPKCRTAPDEVNKAVRVLGIELVVAMSEVADPTWG